jgi:hypothetical protein
MVISHRREPHLNQLLKGQNMQIEIMGAASFTNIAARINAEFPKISIKDYGLWNIGNKVIQQHPDWSEDQVYAEVRKSFLAKSSGGLLVTKTESAAAIAKRDTQRKLMLAGIVGAIGFVVWKSLKKRR